MTEQEPTEMRVWDPFVRPAHWTIVVAAIRTRHGWRALYTVEHVLGSAQGAGQALRTALRLQHGYFEPGTKLGRVMIDGMVAAASRLP